MYMHIGTVYVLLHCLADTGELAAVPQALTSCCLHNCRLQALKSSFVYSSFAVAGKVLCAYCNSTNFCMTLVLYFRKSCKYNYCGNKIAISGCSPFTR